MTWKNVEIWAHGLFSGVITGACTSGLCALGVTGAEAIGINVPQLSLKQLGIVALTGGIVGAMAYLKQSPLPKED